MSFRCAWTPFDCCRGPLRRHRWGGLGRSCGFQSCRPAVACGSWRMPSQGAPKPSRRRSRGIARLSSWRRGLGILTDVAAVPSKLRGATVRPRGLRAAHVPDRWGGSWGCVIGAGRLQCRAQRHGPTGSGGTCWELSICSPARRRRGAFCCRWTWGNMCLETRGLGRGRTVD